MARNGGFEVGGELLELALAVVGVEVGALGLGDEEGGAGEGDFVGRAGDGLAEALEGCGEVGHRCSSRGASC